MINRQTAGQTGTVQVKHQWESSLVILVSCLKRPVDNLNVAFHEDHGVGAPKSYVIEYYVGSETPTVPKNPSL